MTNRFYNCYQNCSSFETDWTITEYCNMYNSMSCGKHHVENFTCRPECLWSCPDVFCDTFSSLVYACDTSYDLNVYFNKTVTEMQCLSAVSSTAPTLTRFQWRIELELKNVDPTVMTIDEAAQGAVTMSISLSLSGIPENRVTFVNASRVTALLPSVEPTALPSSFNVQPSLHGLDAHTLMGDSFIRRLRGSLSVSAELSCFVIAEVTGHLEELGFTNTEATVALTSLKEQLSRAIDSGEMARYLVLSGLKLGTRTLVNVNVLPFDGESEIFDVIPLITYSPTVSPTVTPPVPFSLLGMETPELSAIFIPIFAFLIVVALVCCCYHNYDIQKSRRAHTKEAFHFDDSDSDSDVDFGDKHHDSSDTSDEDYVVVEVDDECEDYESYNENEKNDVHSVHTPAKENSYYHTEASSEGRSCPRRELPRYQSKRSKSKRFKFESNNSTKDNDDTNEESTAYL